MKAHPSEDWSGKCFTVLEGMVIDKKQAQALAAACHTYLPNIRNQGSAISTANAMDVLAAFENAGLHIGIQNAEIIVPHIQDVLLRLADFLEDRSPVPEPNDSQLAASAYAALLRERLGENHQRPVSEQPLPGSPNDPASVGMGDYGMPPLHEEE